MFVVTKSQTALSASLLQHGYSVHTAMHCYEDVLDTMSGHSYKYNADYLSSAQIVFTNTMSYHEEVVVHWGNTIVQLIYYFSA